MRHPRRKPKKHYANEEFLALLGTHCRRIRKQKGLSIDRVAKQSDHLSSSVIHRLESGSGPVTVSSLFRYAEVLGVPLDELVRIPYPDSDRPEIIAHGDPRVPKEAFQTLLPVYSLRAAAGYFGEAKLVEPEGWIPVPRLKKKLTRDMFVARIVGNSMAPRLHDGALGIFQFNPTGSKQGRIVLAQYRGPADPETGGSFTVKKYSSRKVSDPRGGNRVVEVRLAPINPEFRPIIITDRSGEDVRIIAELISVIDS